MHILLCEPEHFQISYKINPWMDPDNNPSEKKLAKIQWDNLVNKIKEFSEVEIIQGVKGLPDMVFTANAGLFPQNKEGMFILSRFKHGHRVREEDSFGDYFVQKGYEIFHPDARFEGAGDALYLNDVLIGGHGFRTEKDFYQECYHLFDDFIEVKLIDPYFYHLDTCFCPLEDGDYLIYPGAFDEESYHKIQKVGEYGIEVPKEEAVKFACNAIVIDQNVIIPSGCIKTESKLQAIGYRTHPLDMSEFMKSGGACKCLTLRVDF